MANYEELYNIAKGKYNSAISERDYIRRKTAELNGKKDALKKELSTKTSELNVIKHKLVLVRDAYNKCNDILKEEFPDMKKDLVNTGDEYKKIITSDKGVADLSSIYSTDLTNTKDNLDSISTDLGKSIKELEGEETKTQKAIDNCNTQISSIKTQINNLGSASAAQKRADIYYSEMKDYEKKWLNGD